MKIYHFVLIFLLFLVATVISIDVSVGKLKTLENEKEQMQSSLDTATSDAINYLASSGKYGSNTIDKNGIISTFFNSLYSSMGISSDKTAQTEIESYIPVILLCDSDGYYVYFYDEYVTGDGTKSIERRWSEKMPYFYEDGYFNYRFMLSDNIIINDIHDFIKDDLKVININHHEFQTDDTYQEFRNKHKDCFLLNNETYELTKKSAIINHLEKVLSYYTNSYNLIAEQNGITYNFSFPSGQTEEWARYMDDVNLVVVFQGYPYGWDRNYTFNKVSSASANIFKKTVYYIEQKSWYFLAHKAGCPELEKSTTVMEETFENLEECAKIGAYCDDCIDHGAQSPGIKKWY